MTLYDIESELCQTSDRLFEVETEIEAMLEKSYGEITPDIQTLMDEKAALESKLEVTSDNLGDKLKGYAQLIKTNQVFAEACKSQADEFTKKAKTATNKAKWLMDRVTNTLNLFNVDKLTAGEFQYSFRKSEAVEVDEDADLDEEYIIRKVSEAPNKIAIKTALKQGLEIPGCRIVTNNNLQLK